MIETDSLKRMLEQHTEKRKYLFAYGFYFTDQKVDTMAYPFYGLWKQEHIANFTLLVHPKQRVTIINGGGDTKILIGHAYDPIKFIADEQQILKQIDDDFYGNLNNLTGVFTLILIKDKKIHVYGDATGMQTTFFTTRDGIQIASHTNLIGDLNGYQWNEYAQELISYRFYPLLGNSMPGDLTQFKKVKRLIPNHELMIADDKWEVKRFYWPSKQVISQEEICDNVIELMRNNLQLIAEKWERPAISLTGGCDSKTTLACANGLYERFLYFSYISSPQESVDAKAAEEISHSLGLKHKTHVISEHDEDFRDLDTHKALLYHNTGSMCRNNANDIRKRCYYANNDEFDVEVKSWASEIGRSYYSKRFNNRKDFGSSPTPRKLTTMYKFFLHKRCLVRKTDQVFKEYLEKYFEQAKENPIDWQEQIFWEFRCSSWNGLVITGEHRYSFDITIPYNNKRILELLLSVPIEDRINDTIYKMIRAKLNPQIDATGIAVTNVLHTHRRAVWEGIYYTLHSKLPL